MTDPRIHEMLARRFDPGELPMNETEEELLRYLSVAAALLPDAAERYKAVSQRFDAEGPSPELRAEALEAAADLAAVLGRAGRHHLLYVVLDERTDLAPGLLFRTLEQIFDSLMLLTEPDPEDDFFTGTRLSIQAVDDHLELDELRDYLEPETAMARLRSGR